MTGRFRFLMVVVVASVLTAAGCGDDGDGATKVRALPGDLVPGEVLGLRVAPETVEAARTVERPFVEAVGLYSFRKDELLQATLQVSRFSDEANATDPTFRRTVVGQIGATAPVAHKVGDQVVYLTTGRSQQMAVWFKGRHLFILATREDFDQPRALLREAITITP